MYKYLQQYLEDDHAAERWVRDNAAMPPPFFLGETTPEQDACHEYMSALLDIKWKKLVTVAAQSGIDLNGFKSSNIIHKPNGVNERYMGTTTKGASHEKIGTGSSHATSPEISDSGFWHIDYANGVEWVAGCHNDTASEGASLGKIGNKFAAENPDNGFWHIDYANGVEWVKKDHKKSTTKEESHAKIGDGSAHENPESGFWHIDYANGVEWLNGCHQRSVTRGVSDRNIGNVSTNEDSDSGFWHIDYANGVEWISGVNQRRTTKGPSHGSIGNESAHEDPDRGFWHIDYADGVEWVASV